MFGVIEPDTWIALGMIVGCFIFWAWRSVHHHVETRNQLPTQPLHSPLWNSRSLEAECRRRNSDWRDSVGD